MRGTRVGRALAAFLAAMLLVALTPTGAAAQFESPPVFDLDEVDEATVVVFVSGDEVEISFEHSGVGDVEYWDFPAPPGPGEWGIVIDPGTGLLTFTPASVAEVDVVVVAVLDEAEDDFETFDLTLVAIEFDINDAGTEEHPVELDVGEEAVIGTVAVPEGFDDLDALLYPQSDEEAVWVSLDESTYDVVLTVLDPEVGDDLSGTIWAHLIGQNPSRIAVSDAFEFYVVVVDSSETGGGGTPPPTPPPADDDDADEGDDSPVRSDLPTPPPVAVEDSAEGAIHRLYLGLFGRLADEAGLAYWTELVESGATITQIASAFLGTPEWAAIAADASDADFVDELYQRILGRPADPSGRNYWAAALGDGAMSRAHLVVLFIESSEFHTTLSELLG